MYPQAYLEYLAHFHGDRDYFECHEVLEEYWKECDPRNKESIWVGLILLAVSNYHHRRSNFKGAKRTLEKAITILQLIPGEIQTIGLDENVLLSVMKARLKEISEGKTYKSFDLPIKDSDLLRLGAITAVKSGFAWGQESDIANLDLIHRHKLRDRTEVIKEREQSLNKRRDNE